MNKLQTGWLYTLTGAVSAVSLAACMPASKPYNIVYIMTDDHTAQMMSCYDNRYIETPNLDRIANDGVRFVNSFVANSLSGPSRACIWKACLPVSIIGKLYPAREIILIRTLSR